MRLVTTLSTVLSHWKTHRFQLFTLFVGLAVATALWSGVQALNAQAKASYDAAAATGQLANLTRLVARQETIEIEDYVALRRAGWLVSPVIEVDLGADAGNISLLGVDLMTLPPALAPTAPDTGATGFLNPPYMVLVHPDDADKIATTNLPEIRVSDQIPRGIAMTDIAVAARRNPDISFLLLLPEQREGLASISEITGGRLREVRGQADMDLSRLTESFHLNLTAFGFLAFVVGLFIVHSTIGLAFEQRRAMFRTMRACGVSARDLTGALLIELTGFALIAGSIGMALGYLIAAALIGDVAASLRGLYGAEVSDTLSLRPSWWVLGLGMSLIGAFTASVSGLWRMHRLPVLAPAMPNAWRMVQTRALRVQSAVGLALLFVALLALCSETLAAGFVVMGGLLMGAALLLPGFLALALHLAGGRAKLPLSRWFWADSQQQIRGLSLALMALLLALSVNIGVGTMVSSFRQTFVDWLDQRLLADLYVIGRNGEETDAISDWLEARPEVEAVLPVWNIDTRLGDWPVEVYGVVDFDGYRREWPVLLGGNDVWDQLHSGQTAMISEQLARYLKLELGDAITLDGNRFGVVATYSDYGNPIGQVVVSESVLLEHWPGVERDRIGAVVSGDLDGLRTEMAAAFGLEPEQHYPVDRVKAEAIAVFERTFSVTFALNVLTFLVAGIALLTSLLTLSTMRLPQLAPLWAMGITRRQLGRIELLRALMLAGLTGLAALPLGLGLAWVLLKVINVAAFGWQLPLFFYPAQWVAILVLALVTAAISAWVPALRLLRVAPSAMLGVFANER